MRYPETSRDDCAIARALGVVGDWWTLLVVREVARGRVRFDDIQAELGVSRSVLTNRLTALAERGVLQRNAYQTRPRRFEYRLTPTGEGLLPVLVALQDWGSRYLLGDGSLTAAGNAPTPESRRVRGLVGTTVPAVALSDSSGTARDPVADSDWTVVFCFPGAYASTSGYPAGWSQIPGASGCTLESTTFRDRLGDFADRDARVVGISTQRPEELAAFASKHHIPYPLLSDQDLALAGALRLPTFRAGGTYRLKRLTLMVRGDREIRGVLYPVLAPAGSVDDALALLDRERDARRRRLEAAG